MTDINSMTEAQGPGSFNDFIAGSPDLIREEQVARYSEALQAHKQTLMAQHAGDTAVSPLIQSMGRNDV